MGRMKEYALEEEKRKAEIQWVELEKEYELNGKQAELDALKIGMPKTLDECHKKLISLIEQNNTLRMQISEINSWKQLTKNHGIGFCLGIIASIIASFLWSKVS